MNSASYTIADMANEIDLQKFWQYTPQEVCNYLQTDLEGLSLHESQERLEKFGYNTLKKPHEQSTLSLFISQFSAPFILILMVAAALSMILDTPLDSYILLTIIGISGLLGFVQEYQAIKTVKSLLNLLHINSHVFRDHQEIEIPIEKVVPGDIVFLKAGSLVPGDCLVIETKDLVVNEAPLTGESFSIEKFPCTLAAATPLSKRNNTLYMGTYIASGFGKALVIHTGKNTLLHQFSAKISSEKPLTAFQKGIQEFSYLLMKLTALFAGLIFAANYCLGRPFLQSFLFTLALSIGLTPQLLPAIITINLAHGARRMAKQNVIVKKLIAIEDIGNIDILCADKTGTLTKGEVELYQALDSSGKENYLTHLYAYLNAHFQTGYNNSIDSAILKKEAFDTHLWQKLDELPYDFKRKCLSVLVKKADERLLITKGAFHEVLARCSLSHSGLPLSEETPQLMKQFQEWSKKGFRVLGLSYKQVNRQFFTVDDEKEATFLGFLLFFDPPKKDLKKAIEKLHSLNTSLKIITGDNAMATSFLAEHLGITDFKLLTGPELEKMDEESLLNQVESIHAFTDLDPSQKHRILVALRQKGHVVGYIGDGINDLGAFHVADVAISVDSAVDLAKENADIVLFNKDLNVLSQGILEGRKTFANTLKYIFMAASANFGNMFSMAIASLLLPFLPLLPTQVLLINLLTDFSEIGIATDRVDPEILEKPNRWNMAFIRRFMIGFGLLSSFFDLTTFVALFFLLNASIEQFRSGWFLESVLSATLISLLIRTQRVFYQSKPSRYMILSSLSIVAFTLILPYLPIASLFGLEQLNLSFYITISIIVIGYLISIEFAKRRFYTPKSSSLGRLD